LVERLIILTSPKNGIYCMKLSYQFSKYTERYLNTVFTT
jgi:hypothetical protein